MLYASQCSFVMLQLREGIPLQNLQEINLKRMCTFERLDYHCESNKDHQLGGNSTFYFFAYMVTVWPCTVTETIFTWKIMKSTRYSQTNSWSWQSEFIYWFLLTYFWRLALWRINQLFQIKNKFIRKNIFFVCMFWYRMTFWITM